MWDLVQHFQIREAKEAAELASHKADRINARKDNTKQELEELTLACQAMWELLRDHLGLTDEQLKAKNVRDRCTRWRGRWKNRRRTCRLPALRPKSQHYQAQLRLLRQPHSFIACDEVIAKIH